MNGMAVCVKELDFNKRTRNCFYPRSLASAMVVMTSQKASGLGFWFCFVCGVENGTQW